MRILVLLLCLCFNLYAQEGAERYRFSSDLDEKRFYSFTHNTRCMVCQNQSVAESSSMFAEDMKNWLYEAIDSGLTDHEIKSALIERFGDSVFYTPPMQTNTWLLWGLPVIFVLIGLMILWRVGCRR